MLTWDAEENLYTQGHKIICGVDEAGRGCLAGPVTAAAVILLPGADIPGLDDSKKLSPEKRGRLFDIITVIAVSYATATASHEEIDELNILSATLLAMDRAINNLKIKPDIAIIDGNQNKGIGCKSICLAGGDGISPSVAAASVIAKVTRDRYMKKLSQRYPEYAFEKHKGYGTKLHYERLRRYGVSEVHRKTFLKGL